MTTDRMLKGNDELRLGAGRLELSGVWKLRGADGQRGAHRTHHLRETDEAKWMEASVPGEVHLELIKQGLIGEPTEGLNALSGRWVEESRWSYRTVFPAPRKALNGHARLLFEGLDYYARIYLNEELIGEHDNFFRPCKLDVTGKLREEDNLLVVVLDSGLYMAGNKSVEGYYENSSDHELHKRIWLRKPQCSFGWDWSARYVNVGIHKPVLLEWSERARLDDLTVLSSLGDGLDEGTVTVRAFVEGLTDSDCEGLLSVRIAGEPEARHVPFVVRPGVHRAEAELRIAAPRLWWPAGQGEQALYEADIEVWAEGALIAQRTRRIGFRKLRINQDPHPAGGRYFRLEVNDRPVFAKGANMIPADMIFIRADRARYETLIGRALEANFNFLRVWGGGVYESDDFYELCDERGIMVWQDFVFACADYPVGDPAFMRNVKLEAVHNVRRLAHHPSLVMYCGNNENEWHTFDRDEGVQYPDYSLYHHILPRIVQEEDPGRYYQPSSPYSPDHEYPNAGHAGDQHPWSVGFENNDFRDYRAMICRFPNEGGMLGSNSLPATLACLPEGQRSITSFAWQQHDNSVDSWFPLSAPDRQIAEWTGRDPRAMSIEQYVYFAGLIQGEGLREYIDNFRRRKFDCASAIFWMFNDCWPTTRSWTIVDYLLNRTPAFHPVKRVPAGIGRHRARRRRRPDPRHQRNGGDLAGRASIRPVPVCGRVRNGSAGCGIAAASCFGAAGRIRRPAMGRGRRAGGSRLRQTEPRRRRRGAGPADPAPLPRAELAGAANRHRPRRRVRRISQRRVRLGRMYRSGRGRAAARQFLRSVARHGASSAVAGRQGAAGGQVHGQPARIVNAALRCFCRTGKCRSTLGSADMTMQTGTSCNIKVEAANGSLKVYLNDDATLAPRAKAATAAGALASIRTTARTTRLCMTMREIFYNELKRYSINIVQE